MLEDTLLALEMGAVETLIVWDEVEIDRCAYLHKFSLYIFLSFFDCIQIICMLQICGRICAIYQVGFA
jgi:hypothetical protein